MNQASAIPPGPEGVRLEVEPHDQAVVVRLAGSAHMGVSGALRDQLLGLIGDEVRNLVLDVADLEFINSMGLGALIAAHQRCLQNGGGVALVAPRPSIRKLLSITKLLDIFPIHANVDSALASF